MILSIFLIIALVSCKKSTNSGGGGQVVRFDLTPYTKKASAAKIQEFTITKQFKFHCIDKTNADCFTAVYTSDPEDDEDWMGYPADYSNCASFIAVVTVAGTEYTFIGSIQRAFGGGGIGPFSIGTYDSYNASTETYGGGTFTFNEQQLTEGTSPDCP